MTKAMKPEDFDHTFAPTRISVVRQPASSYQYLLQFDNRYSAPDQANCMELDHELVLRIYSDVRELIDPAPEYAILRTLKNIEAVLKDISKTSDS